MMKCISTLAFLAFLILPVSTSQAAGSEILQGLTPISQRVLDVPTTPECPTPCFWYGGERYRLTSYLVDLHALDLISRDGLVIVDVFKPVLAALVATIAAYTGPGSCLALGLGATFAGGLTVVSYAIRMATVPEEVFTRAIRNYGRHIGPNERDRLRRAAIILKLASGDAAVKKRLHNMVDILDQLDRRLFAERQTWKKTPEPHLLRELQRRLQSMEGPCPICIQSMEGTTTLVHETDQGDNHFFCKECAEAWQAFKGPHQVSEGGHPTPETTTCPLCRAPWMVAWEVPWPIDDLSAIDAIVAEPDEPFGDVATDDEISEREAMVAARDQEQIVDRQPSRVRVFRGPDEDSSSVNGSETSGDDGSSVTSEDGIFWGFDLD